ncbi:MAG TPA: hypothetical protein PKE29_04845 [Phycisphaerales bacterium]|nr:hypothetical protein [Phycisphaerales bacterium]
MKPHPKLRKTIKWGGAAVTVLLVVASTISMFWSLQWNGRSSAVGLDRARLIVVHDGPPGASLPPSISRTPPGWYAVRIVRRAVPCWWPETFTSPIGTGVSVPLWLALVPALVASIAAWRLDTLARRRARVGCCPKCNYDRAGIAKDAVCPECGSGSEASG